MFVVRRESKVSGIIKALVAIAFGIFLIVTKANAMTMVVQIIAAALLVFGVLPLLLSLKYPVMQELSEGSFFRILIAVLLLVFADDVGGVLRYIIGGILCVFGISQVLSLIAMPDSAKGGLLPFALPVVLFLLGLMFFSEELIGKDIMGQLAGLAFILYGVSKGLSAWKNDKKGSGYRRYDQFEDNSVDEQ